MTATANGKDVLNLVISEPRVGVWTAEFDADSDTALTGKVTLEVDGERWVGTVMRGDVASGRSHARIVGGAGNLGEELAARFYVNATLGSVLADIMSATGETLAPSTEARVLGRRMDRWARSNAGAGQALRQVATEAGASWRVLRDGTVWLGTESWPEAKVVYAETDHAPARGSVTIAPDGAPSLAPGMTFQKQQVSVVTTRVSASGIRQEALFEDGEAGELGRGLSDIAAVVESLVGNRLDYGRMYPAKVVKQSADLQTLELLADHVKVRGTGITRVPIRHGLPGVSVKVNAGSRVLLFFEEGDPKKPAAALWADGSSTAEIHITTLNGVTIHGDLNVTGEVTARSDTTKIALSDHKHPTAMGPSDNPIPTP